MSSDEQTVDHDLFKHLIRILAMLLWHRFNEEQTAEHWFVKPMAISRPSLESQQFWLSLPLVYGPYMTRINNMIELWSFIQWWAIHTLNWLPSWSTLGLCVSPTQGLDAVTEVSAPFWQHPTSRSPVSAWGIRPLQPKLRGCRVSLQLTNHSPVHYWSINCH